MHLDAALGPGSATFGPSLDEPKLTFPQAILLIHDLDTILHLNKCESPLWACEPRPPANKATYSLV